MKQESLASFHAFVAGRVQGVFFRMFVLREAQALGLAGYVRNMPDGRLEVVAEGERQKLEQLVERLKQGPPRAMVTDVDVSWAEYRHEYSDFSIQYS
ncbi:MAG: acylphosphatase [candidate division WOR-3 bacterium]